MLDFSTLLFSTPIKLLSIPVSGYALCLYVHRLYGELLRRGYFDFRMGTAAQSVVRSLQAEPQGWRRLGAHYLVRTEEAVDYSSTAPIRIWVANGERHVALDGEVKKSFTALEKRRIWALCQSILNREADTRAELLLVGDGNRIQHPPASILSRSEGIGEVAYWCIRALREHPEKWQILDEYEICFARKPVKRKFEAETTLWIKNGERFVELRGKVQDKFTPEERAAVWQAYQQWLKDREAIERMEQEAAARRIFGGKD